MRLSEDWETPTQVLDETETVFKPNRITNDWEQSRVTRISAAPDIPAKFNPTKAVITVAVVICLSFICSIGGWIFLSSLGSGTNFGNKESDLSRATPTPTPTNFNRTSIRNQKTNSEQIHNKSTPKISVGGESFKACDRLVGSGIYGKWLEMGGGNGKMGCPLMNETEAPRSPNGTTGRMTQFSKGDGGYLVWHGSGRFSGITFEVSGCMFKLYSSLGGTASWLGFPVKDGFFTPTGARQDFESGYILWDSKNYHCRAYRN